MLKKHLIAISIVSILVCSFSFAQKQVLYKQIDTVKLFVEIHFPEKMDATKKYPAMVFFFGGGWKNGNKHHFLNQAKYFSLL